MKRYGYLYEKVICLENLYEAEKKARKGKTKSYGVRMFDKNKDEKLRELHEILKRGEYKTSKYTTFKIYEPKERTIYRLPYYPDRIVHHAVMDILEPIWVKIFIKGTYSCIKNRGIHAAVNDIKHDLKYDKAGTMYCLKMDIRHFYPSIDHGVLKDMIRKKIKDTKLLALLDEIIDSTDGVPIGNYLSQYFANIYLTSLDHQMKEIWHAKYYYRYADDIVILDASKEQLHELLMVIKRYLSEELKLELKHNWQVFPVESRGIDFLGYVFRHTYTRLRKETKHRLFKKVIAQSNSIKDTDIRKQTISSYYGWLKYCNSKMLKTKLNTYYNEQIFM